MELLVEMSEVEKGKTYDLFPCKCKHCGKTFFKTRKVIKRIIVEKGEGNHGTGEYCDIKCRSASTKITQLEVECKQCGKNFIKRIVEIKKSPNHYCSHSCAATYQNTHKTHGTRRSKLETYIEERLKTLFLFLPIDFNKKDAIDSELDIYIPSLKLAIELNGIFHYEPIYGQDKLDKIQNNDNRKFQACIEKGISFCTIDSSSFKNFKKEKADKFVEIISGIIKQHIRFKNEDTDFNISLYSIDK